jgi:hypothetical protein
MQLLGDDGEDPAGSSSEGRIESPTSSPTSQVKDRFLLSFLYLGIVFVGFVVSLVLCYRCFCKSNENKKRMVNVFAES